MLAPSAPTKWESGLTLSFMPSFSSNARTMPMLSDTPAGESHFRLDADAPHQRNGSCGDGAVHAAEDVLGFFALGEVGHDVRFDEYRADGGEAHRILRLERDIADIAEAHAQSLGGAGEESSCAGGALVVHNEVFDVAVFADFDALGVLPAHIDDGAGVGKKIARAARMATDLGDLRVAEGHFVSAVTGADYVGDSLPV